MGLGLGTSLVTCSVHRAGNGDMLNVVGGDAALQGGWVKNSRIKGWVVG